MSPLRMRKKLLDNGNIPATSTGVPSEQGAENLRNLIAWRRIGMTAMGVVVAATMAGCVSTASYVDAGVKDIDTSTFHKPDPLHPVQVLFDFQSKGVDNARATNALKTQVIDQVAASGLFSKVGELPAADGALLTITVNNVPVDDNVVSKGVATGLTFGLAGSEVSDAYVATARYTAPGAKLPIVKEVRHAIHSTIGHHAPPANAVPAASITEAVSTMLHQSVSNLLNDVSHDEAFK